MPNYGNNQNNGYTNQVSPNYEQNLQNQQIVSQMRQLTKPKNKWFRDKKKLMLFGGGILILVLIFSLVFVLMGGSQTPINQTTKTITFWTREIDEDIVNGIISDFEKENPSIKVKFEKQSETDYESRMTTRLKLKSPNMGNIIEIEESWLSENFIYFNPIVNTTVLGRYSNASLKNNTVSNQIFAIPFTFDTLVLAYNVNHIQEIGYNQETFNKLDWTFLSSRVKTLTKTQKAPVTGSKTETYDMVTRAGIAIGSPKNVTNAEEIFQLLLIQNDSKNFDPTKRQFKLDTKFIDVQKFYTDFTVSNVWKEYIGNDIEGFINGKVSLVLVRTKDIDYIKQKNSTLNFSTTTPAKIGGIQTISLSKSLAVPNHMPNYSESIKFLEYFTKVENGMKLFNSKNAENTFIPGQLACLNQIPRNSPFAVLSDISPTAEKFNAPYYTDTTNLLSTYLTESYDNYYRLYPQATSLQPLKYETSRFETELNNLVKTKDQNK